MDNLIRSRNISGNKGNVYFCSADRSESVTESQLRKYECRWYFICDMQMVRVNELKRKVHTPYSKMAANKLLRQRGLIDMQTKE